MGYENAKNWLVYFLVRLFVCVAQAIPIGLCQRFSRLMAILAWNVLRLRRQVIDDNLRHAFPSLSANERALLGRGMWEHLCLMVCEIAQTAGKIHRTNWRRHIKLAGQRELVTMLLDDRPLVLVSAHFGNFELAGYAAGFFGFTNHTIARALDNPYLDHFIGNFRRLNGQHILPKQGSSAQVQEILNDGGTLVLLGDQYAGPKGCWVTFFGRPASCHKAIALFSLTNNAPLATCYARRLETPLHFSVELAGTYDPAVESEIAADISAVTQWYNEILESAMEQYPKQYWWVHRRWKGRPPPVPPKLDS